MAKKKKRHTGKNIAYMYPEMQQKRAQPSCSAMLIFEGLFVAVDFFTVAIRSYLYTISAWDGVEIYEVIIWLVM